MPKKPSRNAFWYFMSDWKRTEESKGRVFPNGFRDVQADPECNDAWRSLSDQQKLPYTNRSKQAKYGQSKEKLNSLGQSVQKIKEEEQRDLDFKLNMESHIRHNVFQAKKYNAIPTLKFYFLHMNWYYMREPEVGPVDFCPAEFAIAEFSLEEGITDYYHEIIKTDLHLGYTREAMETSEKTHKLNWDLAVGEGDWRLMYKKFISFIKPGMDNDELPAIYTTKKIAHIIPSLLRRLTAHTDANPEDFLIYTVESLFAYMLRAVNEFTESNVLGVLADTQFDKEPFAYTPNIECDYHKTQDGTGQYCSLSVVRQWGFTFCDHCCKPMKIEMLPGVHCPEPPSVFSGKMSYCKSESVASLTMDRPPSVLSATGVSEAHRIRVSERNRDDAKRREGSSCKLEIIDHSLLKDDDSSIRSNNESVAYVAAPVPVPMRRLRKPTTASQAVIGVSRDVPIFDREQFPIIGGRGAPMKIENNEKPNISVWKHRG